MNRVILGLGLSSLVLTRRRITCDGPLSAYDKKEDPVYLVPEPPSELQTRIKEVRVFLRTKGRELDGALRETVDQIIMFEHKAESTIRRLKAKDEDLVPGVVYIGTATLFSSILTRRRALPIRAITPLLFAVVSSRIFLPKLSSNIADLAYSYEPAPMRVKHDEMRAGLSSSLWKAGEFVESIEKSVETVLPGKH